MLDQPLKDNLIALLSLSRTSTHLPWIGFRSADPDGAHVKFIGGIANTIGVKERQRDADWQQRAQVEFDQQEATRRLTEVWEEP